MVRTLPIFACILLLSTVSAAQSTEWRIKLDGPAHSPVLYPSADEARAVAVAAGDKLFLIDGTGHIAWTAEAGANLGTPPTVADIDNDGKAEIVAALFNGEVRCYAATGDLKWKSARLADTSGGFKNVVAADVAPAPGLEILIGFDNGWLNCLGADGGTLWRFHGDKYRVGGIAVADANDNGAPEIFYGTDNGHIYCLDGHGRVQWRYFELAPYGRSGPNIADLEGDGSPELLITRSNVGSETCLMALDAATGKYLWRTADYMQSYFSNAVADIDNDGRLEVFHADKGNMLYCDNADGSRRWQIELAGRGIFWAPAVADIDGDGHVEILTGCRNTAPETGHCFYVVSDAGQLEHALALGGGSNASPAVADIDGDGALEVVAVTNAPDEVVALSWGGSGRVCWPSLRGDSAMRAAKKAAASAPAKYVAAPEKASEKVRLETGDAAYWGENTWQASWENRVSAEAFLEVRIDPEDGSAETTIVDLKPGTSSLKFAAWLKSAGPTAVTVALHEAAPRAGQPQFLVRRNVQVLPPDHCSLEAVAAAVEEAVAPYDAASGPVKALRRELSLVKADAAIVRGLLDASDPDAVAEAATALRTRAAHLKQRALLLAEWWRSGGGGHFVCWQDANPWDAFDPFGLPPEFDEPIHVTVKAYQNEFENIALTLLNITGETVDVRCVWNAPDLTQARPKPDPDLARHIRLRRLIPVGTALSDRVFDALPELDLSRSVSLAPGEARQVWLEIDTHGLEPGVHDLTLYLASLTKPVSVIPVKLNIDIWPVELPDAVFKKMNWSNFSSASASDQAVRDMIEHGVNVIYGPNLPQVPVDAEGNLAGEIDWTRFDEELQRVPGHFTMFWGGPPSRKWPEGKAPEPDSELYFNGFRTAVRELAAHLRGRGFPYGQWAFYPIDEPWNTGATHVEQLKRFSKMVKRADTNAPVYTDPAGGVRAEYLDEFKGLIDIWQPEVNHLKRDESLRAWFQQNAPHFWTYEATGPAKDLLPLGYYRAYGWLAWQLGVQGAGYWVYRGVDIWWPVEGGDYSAVYQTDRSIVPSRRWQADRDGVEDYRALYVLRQEIEAARSDGRTAEAGRAQALMDEAVAKVAGWQIDVIDEVTRQTREYELDFDLLLEYREAIANEIARLH